MALVSLDLATALYDSVGSPTDSGGGDTFPTEEIMAYADGIIAALRGGTATFAPGLIQATGPIGSPITGINSTGGIMVGLLPSTMYDYTQNAGNNSSTTPGKLLKEHTAVLTYLGTNGIISHAGVGITGNCTATVVSAGPLANGSAVGGVVSGLDGSVLAGLVGSALEFTGPDMQPFYEALCNYIINNTEINFSTITGTFPVGGGVLTLGAGVGGVIS